MGENKKMGFIQRIKNWWKQRNQKALPEAQLQYKEPENKTDSWQVPSDTVKSPAEIALENDKKVLETMLDKELNSKEDAYENIVEMKRFLSYSHDNLPEAADKINKKFAAIQNVLGNDILKKGMEIAENDSALLSMSETLNVQDKVKMQNEIIKSTELAEKLNWLRYNPQEAKKQTGKMVNYQAVYAKMVQELRDKQNMPEVKSGEVQGKSLNEQLSEMQSSQTEISGR